MKKLLFLSGVCFLLTGCYGTKNSDISYSQNNLRAPTPAPVATPAPAATPTQNHKPSDMPQSITQPAQASTPQSQTEPVKQAVQQPQQPLVQTIVIPQYAPQMGYGSLPVQPVPTQAGIDMGSISIPNTVPSFNNPTPPMGAVLNSADTINVPVPSVSSVVNAATAANTVPTPTVPVVTTPAVNTMPPIGSVPTGNPVPPVNIAPAVNVPAPMPQVNTPKEAVYPSWASSDYTPPSGYNVAEAMIYLKNPQYNEIVQCASVDLMCINTYKQQGYQEVSGGNGFVQKQDAGYPRTPARESENSNIPRW